MVWWSVVSSSGQWPVVRCALYRFIPRFSPQTDVQPTSIHPAGQMSWGQEVSRCLGGIGEEVLAWTAPEQLALERALKAHPADLPARERWDLIAADVPGRTRQECVRRYKQVATKVQARHRALVDIIGDLPLEAEPAPQPAEVEIPQCENCGLTRHATNDCPRPKKAAPVVAKPKPRQNQVIPCTVWHVMGRCDCLV